MNDDTRLLKLSEVKDWLKIGTTYVYELIKQGKLPKPLKQGKASFWQVKDIKDYIASLPRE